MADKLTEKQAKFIKYLKENPEATNREAYLFSYDVKTKNLKTIDPAISKLLKTPSIVQAMEEINRKVQDKIAYSAVDSFEMLKKLQDIALNSPIPEKSLKDAIKCEELKGKLIGAYVEKKELSGGGGQPITLNVITHYDDVEE